MRPQFLLHILLSMGRFETERQLMSYPFLRECLRYAKLIGDENNEASLTHYSNDIFAKFVKEQMRFYPDGQRIIDSWTVITGDLFDEVIINNEIPIPQIPSVQSSALLLEIKTSFKSFKHQIKIDMTQAILRELRDDTIQRCDIPPYQYLINTTFDSPFNWNAVESF